MEKRLNFKLSGVLTFTALIALMVGGVFAEAGHKKNFFIASEDGDFTLKLEGQVQSRLLLNLRDEASGDNMEMGFQQRRTKLGAKGHIYQPQLQYKIKAGFERSGGGFVLEEGYAQYDMNDKAYIKVGQFKGRFNREEGISSSKQQAVERSNVNEFFTLDYSQGIEVGYVEKKWDASLTLHDGRESDNVNFADDFTDVALAGRVQTTLMGQAKQFSEFAAWSGDEVGLQIGAGADFELAESENGGTLDNFIQWTGDLAFKGHGLSVFGAALGRNIKMKDGSMDAIQMGFLAQAGAFLVKDLLDVFGRWEMLQYDGMAEVKSDSPSARSTDDQSLYTLGFNVYLKKHHSKISADVVLAPDGIASGESGGGTLSSTEMQTAVRTQFQLGF